jgi:uncharacterized membrane protein
MSLDLFLGFLTGNVIVLIAAAFGLMARRKRAREVEEDERTVLIRAKSGAAAFYLSGVAVYIAWVADNIMAHMRGDAIRLFSPMGVVLAVMLGIWAVSFIYHKRQLSAGGELTEAERKKQIQVGLGLLCMSVALYAVQTSVGHRNPTEVRAVLLFLQVLLLVLALKLLVGARKKANQG